VLRPIRPRPTGYIYYLQSLGTYYQLSIPRLVTMLSHKIGVGVSQETPRSAKSHLGQVISTVLVATARSSASVLD
jgi:hypothetical protein